MEKHDFTIQVQVVNVVGDSWFGIATIGGATLRGPRCANALDAARMVFAQSFSGGSPQFDEAMLALEMAIAGVTIEDLNTAPALDAPSS